MIVSNLLKENYMPKSYDISMTASISESFFESALVALFEMNTSFAESKKSLYKGILEAEGNPTFIHESFTGFLGKVRAIIDKFLESIKRLYTKFITMLNKFVKSDKYILKNKKLFSKFNGDHEFEMNIFLYTFDDTIPAVDASAIVGWDKAAGYSPFNSVTDVENSSIADKVELRYNTFKDTSGSDSYDACRGLVIGKRDISIPASDYAEELFKIFRDGQTDKIKTTIDAGRVNESITRFVDYDKNVKAITDKKNEIEKIYTGLKDTVKKWADNMEGKSAVNLILGGGEINISDTEDMKKINNYAQMFASLMVNRIEQMSAIHGTAFSAKLDAFKECYAQDKKILYGALTRLRKDKSIPLKESEGEEYLEDDEEEIPEYVDTVEYTDDPYDEYEEEDD